LVPGKDVDPRVEPAGGDTGFALQYYAKRALG